MNELSADLARSFKCGQRFQSFAAGMTECGQFWWSDICWFGFRKLPTSHDQDKYEWKEHQHKNNITLFSSRS
jgi:hypothetical protein